MMKKLLVVLGSILLLSSCSKQAFLFTSFHEPADEGLRMLYSYDGYKWHDFKNVFLKPLVGQPKIMRDPSMVQGSDGVFHLVWTTEWHGGNGFGYASSRDLIHWSEEKYIPVMKDFPTVVNVWAPEVFYDDIKKDFIIVWASTIPFKFPRGQEDEDNNHRLYYTVTKDFKTFSDAGLFLDPGFSAIDATIVKRKKDDYVLVFKDNTRPERDIKVAFGKTVLGPWENVSRPVTEEFTEGPSVVKIKDRWLIYFDAYRKKSYEAISTKNFRTFENIDDQISVPVGHKHGTIVPVKKKFLKTLIREVKNK